MNTVEESINQSAARTHSEVSNNSCPPSSGWTRLFGEIGRVQEGVVSMRVLKMMQVNRIFEMSVKFPKVSDSDKRDVLLRKMEQRTFTFYTLSTQRTLGHRDWSPLVALPSR